MNSDGETPKFESDILAGDGFNRLARGRYGYILYNKNDTYVGRSIEQYGEYGEAEAGLLKQICQPNDIVVEVGANIGSLTVPMARAVGNRGLVLAFEPQPIVFQTLCGNLALNSLTNVRCFRSAVGAEGGHVFIPGIRYDKEGNFGGVSVDGFDKGFKVPKVTLDETLDIPRCKMIKIDVEGMEAEVITGAAETIKKFRPALYVENDRKEKSPQLIELLWSMDYKLVWHLTPLFNPENFAGKQEDVFGRIVSLNMLCVPKEKNINLPGANEITDSSQYPKLGKPPADQAP